MPANDNADTKERLEPSKINDPLWANHYLDDWKYRHDAYARMTYRYIWSLVVLAALPLIPLPAQLNPEFLQHVRQGTWYTLVYWFFVVFVLVCTSVQLWREYHHLEEVRQKLQNARGVPPLSAKEQSHEKKWIRRVRFIYFAGFAVFFAACILIPWKFHPEESKQAEVVTRMTNNEQFTVHFNTPFPPECSMDPAWSVGVLMKYDRNTHTWAATIAGNITEWGYSPSSQRTEASYTPEKHLLIIGGTGFWFDDDQKVYRSCGRSERQVGSIEFSKQNSQQ
jgi:NADH:ubiquinone oxidoreductase subunit 5 (subunit L)/multisubunit Na+/H+ antiporter MnhA subunit